MSLENSRLWPHPEEAPWLIYGLGGPNKTFCTMSPAPPNNNSYQTSIPYLREKVIFASSHGWLFLLYATIPYGIRFSLWNPVTFKSISLPILPYELVGPNFSTVVLTAPPDENDSSNRCVVMFFNDEAGLVGSYRPLRDDCWFIHKVEIDGEPVLVRRVTTLDGAVYAWVSAKNGPLKSQVYLACIEVAHNDDSILVTFRSLHIRKPKCDLPYSSQTDFLVASCGRIYCISLLERDVLQRPYCVVKVFEIDLLEETCRDMNCLQGRTFFLSSGGCAWCWGSTDRDSKKVAGNSVYFVSPKTNALYSYNLYDQTYNVFRPCPSQDLPFGYPLWLIPRYESGNGSGSSIVLREEMMINGVAEPVITEQLQRNVAQVDKILSDLPVVLTNILPDYLHLFDYWNFRATVKISESTYLPAPQWKTNNSHPLFIFLKNNYKQCQVMDPTRDDPVIFDLMSRPFIIEYSKDGWLIISTLDSLQLYNPFTKERRYLPVHDDVRIEWMHSIGYSTNITSSDCLIVAGHVAINGIKILYLKPGDNIWNCCSFDHGAIRFNTDKSKPVFYKGAFYFLDSVGNIGQFKLVDGEGKWKVFRKPKKIDSFHYSCYLVKCNGRLYSVLIEYWGSWVRVFKFSSSREKWYVVKDIKDHALFVSNSSCYSVVATDMRMRNRIYLPRFKGNSLVFYSLVTQNFYVVGKEDVPVEFCDMKEPLNCCWF